jgi:hypothetical protein
MASAPARSLRSRAGGARPDTRAAHRRAEAVRVGQQTPLGPARILGAYTDAAGERQLMAVARPDASILVLDAVAGSLADARVVAHLDADEPRGNALLIVRMYLADSTRGRCRRLDGDDLVDPGDGACAVGGACVCKPAAIERAGVRYEIRPVTVRLDSVQLRWTRSCPAAPESLPLTLREVIGTLQCYEPARSITARALGAPVPANTGVSHLSLELARLVRSPIVLNRRLREAVGRAVLAGATMSEIAMRCSRFKRDRNGRRSGETSWLARRIGQMPEAGQARPTPWIHSDTLALIAREGLDLSPREVEL